MAPDKPVLCGAVGFLILLGMEELEMDQEAKDGIHKQLTPREQREKEIAARVTEIQCDLRLALDYVPCDGVLRLSKGAAVRKAKNALQPDATLIELFEGLPSLTEIKLTPVRKEVNHGPFKYEVSVGMKISLPE